MTPQGPFNRVDDEPLDPLPLPTRSVHVLAPRTHLTILLTPRFAIIRLLDVKSR